MALHLFKSSVCPVMRLTLACKRIHDFKDCLVAAIAALADG